MYYSRENLTCVHFGSAKRKLVNRGIDGLEEKPSDLFIASFLQPLCFLPKILTKVGKSQNDVYEIL